MKSRSKRINNQDIDINTQMKVEKKLNNKEINGDFELYFSHAMKNTLNKNYGKRINKNQDKLSLLGR